MLSYHLMQDIAMHALGYVITDAEALLSIKDKTRNREKLDCMRDSMQQSIFLLDVWSLL